MVKIILFWKKDYLNSRRMSLYPDISGWYKTSKSDNIECPKLLLDMNVGKYHKSFTHPRILKYEN